MRRLQERGKLSITLAIGVLLVIVAAVAWWLLRPSSTVELEPLEPTQARSGDPRSPAADEPVGASERYPGRRTLEGPDAPAGVATATIGETLSIGDGHRARALEYQATLRASNTDAAGDLVVDVVRIEVCAGNSEWTGGALTAAFQLAYPRVSGGFDLRPASSGIGVREPLLSRKLTGETLDPGKCREGWVSFVLGSPEEFDDRLPTSILFDNSGFGFVPANGRGSGAWQVPR